MSVRTLNYPFQLVNSVNNQRNPIKPRAPNPTFSVKSSILLRTDENTNLPDSDAIDGSLERGLSGSILNQLNTVGIVGGVSATSTLNFLKRIVGWSSVDGEETLPFVLCNNPELNRELSNRERGKARANFDSEAIVKKLRRKREFLERSGARCIVMPCHFSHSWHSEVSEGCSVPFLNMAECVTSELKEADLKPIEAGSCLRIGLLAPEATLNAGFYQEQLQSQDADLICKFLLNVLDQQPGSVGKLDLSLRALKWCCLIRQQWSIPCSQPWKLFAGKTSREEGTS
ncbi:hypothetical protein AMTRI_Chr05g62300 [Amborella trichopoda]